MLRRNVYAHDPPSLRTDAALYLRRRVINPVDIHGDGRCGDIDPASSAHPSIAYRNADYDTNPGLAMTKKRVGVGDVDMEKASGRKKGGLFGDVDKEQTCNEGETSREP